MDEVNVTGGSSPASGHVTTEEIDRTAQILAGTSISEAAVAAGGGVLAILGLVGVIPSYMAPIATIAIGASLLIEGAGHAARVSQLRALSRTRFQMAAIGGGVSAEVTGGLSGLTLGILALVGVVPIILMSAAVIVFGATLLFASGGEAEVESAIARAEGAIHVEHTAVQVANSANGLVGIGSIVLGILSLTNVGPGLTLVLIALLAVAASLTLSGSTMGTEMGLVAKRH